MEKIDRPKGLIRYDTEEGIEQGKKWRFTGRAKAYSGVLILLIGLLTALMMMRDDVESVIVRSS